MRRDQGLRFPAEPQNAIEKGKVSEASRIKRHHTYRIAGSYGTIAWAFLTFTEVLWVNYAILIGTMILGPFWFWQFRHGMRYRPWLTSLTIVATLVSAALGWTLITVLGLESQGDRALAVLVIAPIPIAILFWAFSNFARNQDWRIRGHRGYTGSYLKERLRPH
jgi:hypothetical protein